MEQILIEKLQFLANKYEVAEFCNQDPSQFLRWYPVNQLQNVEVCSFIAAMLAFGNRKQFIPKIKLIMKTADLHGGISSWCIAGAPDFPKGQQKFYRFYSYDDMHILFAELAEILKKSETLGSYFYQQWQQSQKLYSVESKNPLYLADVISSAFPKSAIVPKGKTSANKRIHMFLRWMVRTNSSVDLGLWNWYSPANLLIPLDVHVMQEAAKLKLIPQNTTASKKTAIQLSAALNQAFPNDPTKGDFALFGLGVDHDNLE